MAQKKQIAQANARKQQLVTQLADARQSISHSKHVFVERCKPKSLLSRLVSRKPKTLFTGSAVGGLVLTLLLKKRPKKPSKSPSPKTTKQILLNWLLTLLKPAAKAWLVARAKKLASERVAGLKPNPQYHAISADPGDVIIEG